MAYDFNLVLHDTLPGTFNYNQVGNRNYVSSIDSVFMDNSYRKQFWISLVGGHTFHSDSSYVALIEGVGSTSGLFYPLQPFFEGGNSLVSFHTDTVPITSYNPCGFMFYTGINKINNQDEITISPNPFTSQTIISFSSDELRSIKITDLTGREIKTINVKGKQLTLDKDEMNNGIYFVQITDEKKNVMNRKIVVE